MKNNSRNIYIFFLQKCETRHQPEYRKFSVDPQITSIEVLQSILIKAFDIKGYVINNNKKNLLMCDLTI